MHANRIGLDIPVFLQQAADAVVALAEEIAGVKKVSDEMISAH